MIARVVDCMNLKYELHLQPYKVVWIHKAAMSQSGLELIQLTFCMNRIWYDILPVDKHKLFWVDLELYDHDVTHFEKYNTYVLENNRRRIVLKLIKV